MLSIVLSLIYQIDTRFIFAKVRSSTTGIFRLCRAEVYMRADKLVPRYYCVGTPGDRQGLVRITQVMDRTAFPKRHELQTPRPGVLSHAKQPSALLNNDYFAGALVSAFELWLKAQGQVKQFEATFTLRCERSIGWDSSGTRTHWLHLRLQCGFFESAFGTPIWHCQVMEVRPIKTPR